MDKTTVILLIACVVIGMFILGMLIYEAIEGKKWSTIKHDSIIEAGAFAKDMIAEGFVVERVNNVVYVREKKDE